MSRSDLLDEFAAWCEVAMLCESGEIDRIVWRTYSGGWLRVAPIGYNNDVAGGLCHLVRPIAKDRLRYHLRRLPALSCGHLWWPQDRAGWDARAAFAWRMAAECEKEMNR